MGNEALKMLESLALAGIQTSDRAPQISEPCEVVREIANSDIPTILQELREKNWSRELGPQSTASVRTLRVGHHQLAQLIAGGVSDVDASYITGRSTGAISSLKRDPAFRELLAYYAEQQKARDLNVYDRLTTIGALASEILQERLEESPERFTNNELRGLLELSAPKDALARSTNAPAGLNIAINFIPGNRSEPGTIEAKVIEGAKSST